MIYLCFLFLYLIISGIYNVSGNIIYCASPQGTKAFFSLVLNETPSASSTSDASTTTNTAASSTNDSSATRYYTNYAEFFRKALHNELQHRTELKVSNTHVTVNDLGMGLKKGMQETATLRQLNNEHPDLFYKNKDGISNVGATSVRKLINGLENISKRGN